MQIMPLFILYFLNKVNDKQVYSKNIKFWKFLICLIDKYYKTVQKGAQ